MSLPMTRRSSAMAQSRGRTSVRVSAAASRAPVAALSSVPGVEPRLEAMLKSQGCASVEDLVRVHYEQNNGDASSTQSWLMEVVGIKSATTARGVVNYVSERKVQAPSGNGFSSPYEAIVLSVLQNYSGLTQDRLFNMLRNGGRFNESQSTLSSILRDLVSVGKVANENGTYRFVSGSRGATPRASGSRSPSPAPSRAAASPRASSPAGPGAGATQSDEAAVLSVLANYSGLTQDRLSSMLRTAGKSVGNVSGVLNSLVSQGKVTNDSGTFRFVSTKSTPTQSRSSSPRAAARSSSPSRPAARSSSASAAGGGNGAAAGDAAVVLSILANYSGLTQERLASMIKNSGKSVSNVSGVLNSLVSQGKVQNDKGTFRYVPSGKTPTGVRTSSPSGVRTPSPVSRSASPRAAASSGGPGAGATQSDEAAVLSVLANYSGLTLDRLNSMLRTAGKSVGNVSGVLNSLVSQGKVTNDSGTFRFVSTKSTPTQSRSSSPRAAVRPSSSPARPAARSSSASAAGGGDGAAAGDAAVVLSILANYSGLTQERLASMIKNSGKSVSNVSSVLNSLVSQGKVQNDKGTFRYVPSGKTPTGVRTSSPSGVRTPSPVSRSASPRAAASSGGPGAGATQSDEAAVLSVLANYSGLTLDRLNSMLRTAGKSVGNVSGVLNSLVSQGKVTNDSGTFRFVSTKSTPTQSRSSSPRAAVRPSSSPARPAARSSSPARPAARSATPSSNGAVSPDDALVLNMLKNYAACTSDRLYRMLRGGGKYTGSPSNLDATLRTLVSSGRVKNDRGQYSFQK